jgi:uncharacterized SAM-binding protein YcdF (DUF218 family)
MVFISKILTAFILPPGCFILGALVPLFFRPKKAVRYCLLGLGLFIYLFTIVPVRNLVLRPLEDRYPPLSAAAGPPSPAGIPLMDEADAIVVLGSKAMAASPDEGGGDSLAAESLKRILYAARLRDLSTAPFIVSGGKVFDRGQAPEAETAARTLVRLGIPEDRILRESESRNTWENARNVRRKYSPKKVILVTSAYHMPRSVMCFERNGMFVIPAPTDYHIDRNTPLNLMDFLPMMGVLDDTYRALHEYFGILYYRVVYR